MEKQFDVSGMTCASCSANVERAVKKVPGVEHVDVSLLNNTMKVDYNDEETNPSQIMAAVDAIGYGATLKEQGNTASKNSMQEEWDRRQKRMEEEQKEKNQTLSIL